VTVTTEPSPGPLRRPDGERGGDRQHVGKGGDRVASAVRWLLPYALLTGVLLLLVRLASRPLDNTDTYFHLRFGREFVSGAWSLGHPGSVSSFATADWVPTQWLPQVVMARVEDWWGLAGVAWLSGLQLLVLAVTFFVVARRRSDPVVAVPVVMVALCACAAGMSMRPQVLSYVLVAVTTSAWLRARETGRTPWWLIPLTWVWAMCHGMWPVGIVIGLVVVVAACLDDRSPSGLRLAVVPVLSAGAACLTPVGPSLWAAVAGVGSRSQYFSEWGAPVFTHLNTVAVLVMLGAVATIAIRRGTTWLEILLLGLAAAWAVYSLRTVPVAAAMLVPLLALAGQRLVGTRSRTSRVERRWVAGAFVGALVLLALQVPSTAAAPPADLRAVDPALGALPSGTNVLSGTGHGGYLMWRFPRLDLVTHGYGDTFTTAELERTATIESLEPGWVELLRGLGVQYAVLEPDSALAYNLREGQGWTVVAHTPDLELLEPPPGWTG
jgi:hypothetical protein